MKVISTTEVLQRSDVKGPRVSQIQVIEINNLRYELPIFSDETGKTIWSLGEPREIKHAVK